ncbi:MAG: hypothetical protein IKN89_12860, partial [Oscillospiraceae bacterium]|nr:hypothetical protein [Oscillospiraceae bacterium]
MVVSSFHCYIGHYIGPFPAKVCKNASERPLRFGLGNTALVHGTHPACIMFRHIARKSWPIQEVFPAIFRQSDENSDCAICAP